MAEVSPRIYGTEQEYAIDTRRVEEKHHTPLELGIEFPKTYKDPDLALVTHMLSNGGRFYKDVNLLEYATAEDTSIQGTIAREFAGERIVMDAMARYVLANEAVASTYIRRRVVGDEKNSSGYHINILADRTQIPSLEKGRMHLMALHIATSQALLGAGAIRTTPSGMTSYSYGQKILDLNLDYNLSTNIAGKKPLINLRDEPHSNMQEFRRIHLTSLDPHISPWAAEMALGTCSLILRAIEQGRGDDLKVITNGQDSIVTLGRKTATDPDHNPLTYIEKSNGEMSITANDIQGRLLEIVAKTEHTDEEERILREWQTAYDDLLTDPMLLVDRSDAIARLAMIRAWNERQHLDPDDLSTNVAYAADSMYDRLFEFGTKMVPDTMSVLEAHKRSVPYRLRTRSLRSRMPSEEAITDAYYNPPLTTRAYGRGRDIKSGNVKTANWDKYLFDGFIISTEDPYIPDIRSAQSS